jgi:hypothetical protein
MAEPTKLIPRKLTWLLPRPNGRGLRHGKSYTSNQPLRVGRVNRCCWREHFREATPWNHGITITSLGPSSHGL